MAKAFEMPDTPFKSLKEALKFAVKFNQRLIASCRENLNLATRLQDAQLIIKQ